MHTCKHTRTHTVPWPAGCSPWGLGSWRGTAGQRPCSRWHPDSGSHSSLPYCARRPAASTQRGRAGETLTHTAGTQIEHYFTETVNFRTILPFIPQLESTYFTLYDSNVATHCHPGTRLNLKQLKPSMNTKNKLKKDKVGRRNWFLDINALSIAKDHLRTKGQTDTDRQRPTEMETEDRQQNIKPQTNLKKPMTIPGERQTAGHPYTTLTFPVLWQQQTLQPNVVLRVAFAHFNEEVKAGRAWRWTLAQREVTRWGGWQVKQIIKARLHHSLKPNEGVG